MLQHCVLNCIFLFHLFEKTVCFVSKKNHLNILVDYHPWHYLPVSEIIFYTILHIPPISLCWCWQPGVWNMNKIFRHSEISISVATKTENQKSWKKIYNMVLKTLKNATIWGLFLLIKWESDFVATFVPVQLLSSWLATWYLMLDYINKNWYWYPVLV